MAKAPQKKKRLANALDVMDLRFGVRPGDDKIQAKLMEQFEIAQMLYAARTAAGLTQGQLAKRAGTTQQVISKLEDADYDRHTTSLLRRIAKALDCRLEFRLVANKAGSSK